MISKGDNMSIVEADKSGIRISKYDQRQLSYLERSIISAIQEDGSSTHRVLWSLGEAFRLGFTAVGRGEADGQAHPPSPDFLTEEGNENEEGFLSVGTKVRWTSQAQGHTRTKEGVIVDVIPPKQVPSTLKWPPLAQSGIGSSRQEVSYVIKVPPPPGSAAMPKIYWPRTAALQAVKDKA